MKRTTPLPVLLAAALMVCSAAATAQESLTGWLFTMQRMKEVRPVSDPTYQSECSECHLAYPPGLLPARSWDLLLTADALQQHFGANAGIDATALRQLRAYALAHAADTSYTKRSRKIAAATVSGPTPLRITQLSSIERSHRQITAQQVSGNPRVKSLSHCDACHTQAAQGVFDNDTVLIPSR
jgi:Dihaem cytochrome c